MFAYGTDDIDPDESCPRVDMITGPGSAWVTAAKREVRGVVGTDAEAGPTEVMILADETADPAWVAADLISQAEHDPAASTILITTSADLARDAKAAVWQQLAAARHKERILPALTGLQSRMLVVDDEDRAISLANSYRAEHLEIHSRDPGRIAPRITGAGASFLGGHSPASLGDYAADSNHIFPTMGGVRHTGALSVQTFLRCMYVVEYDREALSAVTPTVTNLTTSEDLPAHAAALAVRSRSTSV